MLTFLLHTHTYTSHTHITHIYIYADILVVRTDKSANT